jgi:hypothetical protein
MKKRLFLILCLLVAFAITAISFASRSATTNSVSVSTSTNSLGVAAVDLPTIRGKHNALPSWTPTEGTAGTISTKGDLFVITADSAADIWVTLYLNNGDKLSKAYTYLNMNIEAYYTTDTTNWATTTKKDIDSYLTLTNGYVSFKLSGHAAGGQYSIGIDGGTFFTIDTGTPANLKPSFYVEVN